MFILTARVTGMTAPIPDPNRFDLQRLESAALVANLEFRDVVTSTQDVAREMAAVPSVKTPTLVLAQTQLAGRGRGTNRWWSSVGGLTFSLIIDPTTFGLSAGQETCLSMAAALAVCETLGDLAGAGQCGIKWPNDVYLAGRKICGLLIEGPPRLRGAAKRIIVGVGVNVNNRVCQAPAEVAAVGTSLLDRTGRRHALTDLVLALLNRLAAEWTAAARSDPGQLARWQALSLLSGRYVTVRQGSRSTSGHCVGVAEDGSLLVETTGGIQRLVGGLVCEVVPRL